jgi:hypothetical protein
MLSRGIVTTEDLHSMAYLHLVRACKNWPKTGTFGGYAITAMLRGVRSDLDSWKIGTKVDWETPFPPERKRAEVVDSLRVILNRAGFDSGEGEVLRLRFGEGRSRSWVVKRCRISKKELSALEYRFRACFLH